MNRSELLDQAKAIVTKDRQATHGKPEDTFARIAALWSAYLGVSVEGYDVAAMMGLLKAARLRANPSNADNWLDLAGYAACGAELATVHVPSFLREPVHDECAHHWSNIPNSDSIMCVGCGLTKQK